MSRLDWTRDGADWPNRTHSRFLRAGGIDWHVQTAGSGPPLLLLHGTGAATHSWRDLLPLLTPHFTVIAPDLPGHGFTSRPHAMGLPAMAGHIAALLTALDVQPAVLVGHSAGSAIAARLALDSEMPPQAIITLCGALLPFPGVAAAIFPAMARLLFANPFVPQLFSLRARMPGEVRNFLGRTTGSKIGPEAIAHYERLFQNADHCAGALSMMAAWDLAALERELPRLITPTLLLHGEGDKTVSATVSSTVSRRLPRGTYLGLPGLGHLAHEEAPDAILQPLLDFARIQGIFAQTETLNA